MNLLICRIGTIVRFELADASIVLSANRPKMVLSCETSPEVSSYCELLMGAAADKPDGELLLQPSVDMPNLILELFNLLYSR